MNPVPRIDSLAGIECYCTDFEGIGGSIKQDSSGFKVSELVDDSLVSNISSNFGESGRYPLYILEKRNIDSNHAVLEIEREKQIRLRVLGIKDAKAVTKQYASLEREWRNPPAELNTQHTRLVLQGFTKRPLGREFLVGNEFEIAIHGCKKSDIDSFIPQVGRIGNFYGLQRFGSERLVTHLVGKAIVKRDFKEAVDLLLCYTTEYDSKTSREIREQCQDPANYKQLLRTIPRGMDIERQILSALVAGKDPIPALRAVPITIRRLFVQAYQSYIFNRCISRIIAEGQDIVKPSAGDLCFEMEGPSVFGRVIKYDASSQKLMVPAVRMAGYTFQAGKGRFETLTKSLMEQENLVPKDFYIKEMQELSQQGGFRQAPLWCRDFSYSKDPLTVSFKLPKGSYATILLRELLKPTDPIAAGF